MRLVRTSIEVTVVVIGWLLGGGLGIGTIVYALLIGPVVQLFLQFAFGSLLRSRMRASPFRKRSVDDANASRGSPIPLSEG